MPSRPRSSSFFRRSKIKALASSTLPPDQTAATERNRGDYREGSRGCQASAGPVSSALHPEPGIVLGDEFLDVVGHAKELQPLLLVERHGKAPQTIDRYRAFLAHLDARCPGHLGL